MGIPAIWNTIIHRLLRSLRLFRNHSIYLILNWRTAHRKKTVIYTISKYHRKIASGPICHRFMSIGKNEVRNGVMRGFVKSMV